MAMAKWCGLTAAASAASGSQESRMDLASCKTNTVTRKQVFSAIMLWSSC